MNQTKLKNSLAKKKKNLPKLKTILATPFPKYWPKIDLTDEESLYQLISNDKNDIKSKEYMHSRGIYLGLGSCLRLIKKSSISCVLLSTELKPSIVITQIINFCLAKNESTKILLVPNLKKITKTLFNIESLTLTCLTTKFPNLENWILSKAENFPLPEKLLQYFTKNPTSESQIEESNTIKNSQNIDVNFNSLYVLKSNGPFLPENAKYLKPIEIDKDWSDNYISFSGTNIEASVITKKNKEENLYDYKTDRAKLVNLIKKKLGSNKATKKIDIDGTESEKSNEDLSVGKIIIDLNKSKKKKKKIKKVEECLINPIKYTPFKINKIQGNPNKKKKPKKNKKKK